MTIQEDQARDHGLASEMNVTDDGSAHSDREQSATNVEDRTSVEDRWKGTPTSLTVDGTANKLVKPIPKKKKMTIQEDQPDKRRECD